MSPEESSTRGYTFVFCFAGSIIWGEENFLIKIENLIFNQNTMSNKFEMGPSPEENKNPKDEFLCALNEELSAMEQSGRISLEQAEEKRKAAALIETGFSDDPKHDALMFSRAGIAGEKETIEILEKKKSKEAILFPENLEDQEYRELQEAMDEEDRIMREIDNVLASTPDRAEAEKIVLERWAPLMDEAMRKSGEALKAWLDTMREAGERERKELDDMKKDFGKE